MPPTARCSAAAASMARSIARPGRNCWPNAKRWAAAIPATPRSPAATGSRRRHVIHAVGPVWSGGGKNEEALLASCYRTALDLAADNRLTSIAFPAISTGVYRFPADLAARIAVGTVAAEIAAHRADHARVVSQPQAPSITRMRSRSWGWCSCIRRHRAVRRPEHHKRCDSPTRRLDAVFGRFRPDYAFGSTSSRTTQFSNPGFAAG